MRKKIISSLFKAQNCTVVAISCKAAFFNYLLRFFYFDLNFAIIFAFLTYFLHNFDLVSIKQLSEATTINFDQFFDQFAKLCAIALQKRLSSWELASLFFIPFIITVKKLALIKGSIKTEPNYFKGPYLYSCR